MSLKLMGRKKGMMKVYDDRGSLQVCTVISLEPNVVVQVKNKEKDGYTAVQIGAEVVKSSKRKNISKPQVGHFAKAKVEPRRRLLESRVEDTSELEIGKEMGVEYFDDVTFVDVCGTSKGKGYQGVMKRHGFKGGPAAHGSGFHRLAGSTGMRSTPGRCLPGVKMSGQMGSEKVTTEGLRVVGIHKDKNVMLVKGAVPGPNNGSVYVRKSLKKVK